MENREFGGIETPYPSAVQSLRSRFERLALDTTYTKTSDPNDSDVSASSSREPSPRPRASSNSASVSILEVRAQLRPSSSSSDLKDTSKRPPPPPPPSRPSKLLQDPPSPSSVSPALLRPVPPPPQFNISTHPIPSNPPSANLAAPNSRFDPPSLRGKPTSAEQSGSSSGILAMPTSETATIEIPSDFGPSVASLRSKFATAPASYRPRVLVGLNVSDPPSAILKPAIPPRPQKSFDPSAPQFRTSPGLEDGMSVSCMNNAIDDAPPMKYPRHPISRDSSIASSDSDVALSLQRPLPRPPPRHKASLPLPPSNTPEASPKPIFPVSGSFEASFPTSSSIPSISVAPPPPLPARRPTVIITPNESPASTPRLPARPTVPLPFPSTTGLIEASALSPTGERRPLGSGRLPPPPTRAIALKDKLPPPRRPPTPSSDEDEGDEEDPKGQMVADLPDSSRSSRRPPTLSFHPGYTEQHAIQVPAFSAPVAVAGTIVVVGHNRTLQIYDLGFSDAPVMTVDLGKETGVKEMRITAVEFRPCAEKADRGRVLWVGTREGHLFEFDARTGTVSGMKQCAHLYPVTQIFRCGRSVFTLDESGKGLVFSPVDANGKDDKEVSMVFTSARVVRVADKPDFVKVVGGKLWTAARAEQQIVAVPGVRAPVVRVYDVFGSTKAVRNVMPAEHVGPVTSATVVPSQPDVAYVGHEEGYVTVWVLEGEDGYPRCAEVVKVSMSDVLCLEGVSDKLWVGGRNGMISAYDITQKPWVVTNCWVAHPGLPVLRMGVDCYGIDMVGRLPVVSVGRDEQLRFWDGLLGVDWVDEELSKIEATFSDTRTLTMLHVSWNCDSARPDSLTGDPANINFLDDVLRSANSPDIISFGFQEVIDLESRKMAAKNVLLGSKKKEDGGLSDKVTGAYKRWFDRVGLAVRQTMPADVFYSVIHSESLVGLFSCVFVKHTMRNAIKDATITTIKRGMGGRYGNKGGIVSRFVIEDSSLCFINCHLAAGQHSVRQRNADIAGMLEEKNIFPETEYPIAYVGGGDGTMVLDHQIVFIAGDLNYRIDHRRETIISAVRSHDVSTLFAHDQLLREIKFNRACRLRGFSEGPLSFPPTYKYDRRSDEYDSSEKRRPPAWCDRILWRSQVPDQVHQLHYRRYEANVSDHRPISAAFAVTIKNVKHDVRQKVKAQVEARWIDEQARLLTASRRFYVKQALI